MDEIYLQALKQLDAWLEQGADPLEVAAVLSTLGLSIYRTVLHDEDYDLMVDTISAQRAEVKKLHAPDTTNNLH